MGAGGRALVRGRRDDLHKFRFRQPLADRRDPRPDRLPRERAVDEDRHAPETSEAAAIRHQRVHGQLTHIAGNDRIDQGIRHASSGRPRLDFCVQPGNVRSS